MRNININLHASKIAVVQGHLNRIVITLTAGYGVITMASCKVMREGFDILGCKTVVWDR